MADGQAGPNRLVDALIGAGVALVFTQVLFSPEPVALLRRGAAALADMADGLELTARALERGDSELDERAMSSLWDLRDRLADLRRTRRASNGRPPLAALARADGAGGPPERAPASLTCSAGAACCSRGPP